ncbi:hypothetical protein [Nocardia sp. NPDC050406]|uniref:hypothetical protein n=1 Tax=Nocardia sp. NPDC050406 TaxID=3364318 RepID=UPI0037AF9482
MGGSWLLGVAFGGAVAAARLDLALRQVRPIRLRGGGGIPPEPEAVVWVLRAALAAEVGQGGEAPVGLVLACPDEWLPVHAGMLAQAAGVVGYPVNLVRLVPISVAIGRCTTGYPGGPASAAACGALLRATDPAGYQPPVQSNSDLAPAAASTRPPARRAPRFWMPGVALAIVIASGTTAVIGATRSDTTASAATASATPQPTTPQPTTPRPTIVISPAAGGRNPAQPGITKPTLPPQIPPPETSEPPPVPEPPAPTTTVQPPPTAVRPVEPEPASPAPPEQPAPPNDMREATIRGFCQGILNQADTFPGGLSAMRARVPPPLFASPADWSEAFDRAAAGSCS